MKALPIVLVGSLAANAVLVATFALQPVLAPPALRDYFQRDKSPASPSESMPTAPASVQARNADAPIEASSPPANLWAALDSDHLPTLIARLRAAGFSRAAVRTIVNARLEEQFAARMKEILAPFENQPFWKPDPAGGLISTGFYEQYNQVYRERSRALRELLGNDIYAYASDPTAAQRRQFGDLPPAKIDLIQRINEDYAEMMSQVRVAMQGITLPEDREKLALLEREKRADLASILGPQELADYEMRSSPLTSRLRLPLTIMDASEAEFQTIFKIQQGFQDRLNPPGGIFTSEMMNQRSEAVKQQAEQIKAALGEARAAEFARASNSEYQQLYRLAQRDGISLDTTNRAFALRDTVAEESRRIMADSALDPEAKRAALKTLGQTTRNQLINTLGQNAGTAYAQSARWVTHVENGGGISISPEGTTSYRNLPMPRN